MLLRAAFWIGVVGLLMPRTGGGVSTSAAPALHGAAGLTSVAEDDFQGIFLQRLAAVKADIEAAERSRTTSGG